MNHRAKILALALVLLSVLLLVPLVASARLVGGEVPLVHLNFHEAYPGGVANDWLNSKFAVAWQEKSDFKQYRKTRYLGLRSTRTTDFGELSRAVRAWSKMTVLAVSQSQQGAGLWFSTSNG
jgi:hypothetical protein